MERIMCFGFFLGALAWAYYRGRREVRKEEWARMQEVAQSLYTVADRCEKQAEAGEETECEEEWMKGAIWVLQKLKEGSW